MQNDLHTFAHNASPHAWQYTTPATGLFPLLLHLILTIHCYTPAVCDCPSTPSGTASAAAAAAAPAAVAAVLGLVALSPFNAPPRLSSVASAAPSLGLLP